MVGVNFNPHAPIEDTSPDEPDIDKAFAETPEKQFDLELPWENDCGRVKNKYGVVIARFENWEQADAVVATMNGSQALMDAVAKINDATPVAVTETSPVQVVDVPPDYRDRDDKIDATTLSFGGILLVANPMMDGSVLVTQEDFERAARQAAAEVLAERNPGGHLRL